MFNILTHGDDYEKQGYSLFLKNKLPSYEIFWQNFIVPLTNRAIDIQDIYTKSDIILQKQFPTENTEKIHERIIILQLHYSAFRMLFKAYKCIQDAEKNSNAFEEFFSAVYSAMDISAELFGRYERIKNGIPIADDPFDPQTSIKKSHEIRKEWEKKHPYPKEIKNVREYRNLMLHGQMFGAATTPAAEYLIFPKPEKINKYLDWRSVATDYKLGNADDLLYSGDIVKSVFDKIIEYLEKEWEKNLV